MFAAMAKSLRVGLTFTLTSKCISGLIDFSLRYCPMLQPYSAPIGLLIVTSHFIKCINAIENPRELTVTNDLVNLLLRTRQTLRENELAVIMLDFYANYISNERKFYRILMGLSNTEPEEVAFHQSLAPIN